MKSFKMHSKNKISGDLWQKMWLRELFKLTLKFFNVPRLVFKFSLKTNIQHLVRSCFILLMVILLDLRVGDCFDLILDPIELLTVYTPFLLLVRLADWRLLEILAERYDWTIGDFIIRNIGRTVRLDDWRFYY